MRPELYLQCMALPGTSGGALGEAIPASSTLARNAVRNSEKNTRGHEQNYITAQINLFVLTHAVVSLELTIVRECGEERMHRSETRSDQTFVIFDL